MKPQPQPQPHPHPHRNWIVSVLCLSLLLAVGCQQLGLPTPETFNERWAAAIGTVTQARTTATNLLAAKKISSADAQNVQDQADMARKGLDIARDLSKTDMSAANARLVMASTVLQALQTYLSSRS